MKNLENEKKGSLKKISNTPSFFWAILRRRDGASIRHGRISRVVEDEKVF